MNDSDSEFEFLILSHNISTTLVSTYEPELLPIVSESALSHSPESTSSHIFVPQLSSIL